MKKLLKFFLVIVGVLFGLGPLARAQVDLTDAVEGTETMFDSMSTITTFFTTFFGVVVVLAILVTGFFLGRKWLRRVG